MFLAVAILLTGCAMERTVLEASVVDVYADPMDELDFLDELEQKRVVTNNDALHALFLVSNEPDMPEDFQARIERARQHGWVSQRATLDPNESARVGMIAVAVCDILDIKGGVTMRVFGPIPRYATRELVFLGIIPRRTENQSLTGLQFIELMSRIEEWERMTKPVRDLGTVPPPQMQEIFDIEEEEAVPSDEEQDSED